MDCNLDRIAQIQDMPARRVRAYLRDMFCPCGGVFEHDDARCDTCNRTRSQVARDAET